MISTCKYPIVFVHGMFGWGADEGIDKKLPYWGATTGNLMDYLNGEGYECYSASVGPISSAWDRACELYARLTGTRVDYGQAHAERFKHRRYGRTYTKPLFDGWGTDKKVHLIGHSFGGTTIRILTHLLTYGNTEEQNATKDGSLSGLFTGGKEDWVQSIVTICTPHNGSVTFKALKKYKLLRSTKAIVYNYAGIMGRTSAQGNFVDFHMEQYGLSDTPGQQDAFPISRAKKHINENADSLESDISPEGAGIVNSRIRISPNVFYFSYFYNAVTIGKDGKKSRATETDFPFLKATATMMMFYSKHNGGKECPNDGLVNMESAKHPEGEPFCTFKDDEIKPGIWNVMPERIGDHGTPIGLFADPRQTHQFYLDILALLQKAENYSSLEV